LVEQGDGSWTRIVYPVNGEPPATVVATGTDGLAPVHLTRGVRLVVRHAGTRHIVMTRFYKHLRQASQHLDLLLETDSLAALWLPQ
jgi:hypothetical protein